MILAGSKIFCLVTSLEDSSPVWFGTLGGWVWFGGGVDGVWFGFEEGVFVVLLFGFFVCSDCFGEFLFPL